MPAAFSFCMPVPLRRSATCFAAAFTLCWNDDIDIVTKPLLARAANYIRSLRFLAGATYFYDSKVK